uniref:Uncharacterized protein n=1 Tax=Arion vulgaris TaxID=1028688 RepID=A0A0B7AY36_9EUPU
MFWPSPEETMSNTEEVVSSTRQYIDQSFSVQHDLGNMNSEPAEKDLEILEYSKQEPAYYASGNNFVKSVTASKLAAHDHHQSQSTGRQFEFPR